VGVAVSIALGILLPSSTDATPDGRGASGLETCEKKRKNSGGFREGGGARGGRTKKQKQKQKQKKKKTKKKKR
jgi:hypothetical protein